MTYRSTLLLGAALAFIPAHAAAQQATQAAPATAPETAPPASSVQPAPTDYDEEGDDAIVVTGARARGSVVGDIPPENTLDSRDVRATGATNINELLEALAPQIGSARGRSSERPVLLLNGQRISGFRELRDLPTEAIERVEILPEEVALKYGYRADQKVVNIVLRSRFRSTAVQLAGTMATDGGYLGGNGDVTRLQINRNGRTTYNLHAEGNGMLTEDERNILVEGVPDGATPDQALAARSLIGTKRNVRGAVTVNRTILGDVSATVNAELEHNQGRSLIGLGETLLTPLARNTTSDTAHLGTTLNGNKGQWHWNVTGNADIEHDTTGTQRDAVNGLDTSRQTRSSGDLTANANGKLFRLPAGDASATVTLGAATIRQDSERTGLGVNSSNSLGRTSGRARLNVDLPISRRNRDFSALGNFTLNGNAEVEQLSDFGTLTTLGAGANWSPVDRLNLLTSWTREEGAPSIEQLGNPILETPGARIFDFTTGETVLATAITGGNPALLADRRNVFKLSANWQPLANTDLRFRADYVHSKTDRPISSIYGPTPALEAAFPDRFVRDGSGQLVSVDLRPINFDSATKDTLRIGFDFSEPLKSRRPSQSTMDAIRSQFHTAMGGGEGRDGRTGANPQGQQQGAPRQGAPTQGVPQQGTPQQGAQQPGARPEGASPPPPREGGGEFRGGGEFHGEGGRGGGFGGGGNRGRLTFSLTDTITLKDRVSIGPGLPELDYLHGEASGGSGGTPRHSIEAQAGWANNGLGIRLGANWRSGTTVNTLTGDDLRFSPLATFNLRLFDNLGEQPDLVVKHPWLRGTQVRFEVNNLFNAKPNVRDASGAVPLSYQPDLLDPLGRTVMISIRKLFSPPPRAIMRERQQEMQAPPPPAAAAPPAPANPTP
ncbi:MAG: TonB-dependent receptor plug domain-containing protein [Pseudomonadota bacterium]